MGELRPREEALFKNGTLVDVLAAAVCHIPKDDSGPRRDRDRNLTGVSATKGPVPQQLLDLQPCSAAELCLGARLVESFNTFVANSSPTQLNTD